MTDEIRYHYLWAKAMKNFIEHFPDFENVNALKKSLAYSEKNIFRYEVELEEKQMIKEAMYDDWIKNGTSYKLLGKKYGFETFQAQKIVHLFFNQRKNKLTS